VGYGEGAGFGHVKISLYYRLQVNGKISICQFNPDRSVRFGVLMGYSITGIPIFGATCRLHMRVMLARMRAEGGVFNPPSLKIKNDSMDP